MMYHPLWLWAWRQQTSLLIWQSGPWWCTTIPSLVTMASAVKKILSWWTCTEILCLSCHNLDLDHNSAIQSLHKLIQHLMMCHQTKVSCKNIGSSEDILESHVLIIWSFAVTLTLTSAHQFFGKTIWIIMTYHHTKFGNERFRNSKDTIRTNIHWHFEILLWPWSWT